MVQSFLGAEENWNHPIQSNHPIVAKVVFAHERQVVSRTADGGVDGAVIVGGGVVTTFCG
jgi:hypothetical protein